MSVSFDVNTLRSYGSVKTLKELKQFVMDKYIRITTTFKPRNFFIKKLLALLD